MQKELIDIQYIRDYYPLITINPTNKLGSVSSEYYQGRLYIKSFFADYESTLNGIYHEICHFAEINIERIFLKNYGLGGIKPAIHDEQYFNLMKKILEREIRVSCFQQNVFIDKIESDSTLCDVVKDYPSILYGKKEEFLYEINQLSEYAGNYFDEMIKIYTAEKFWNDFEERYALLKEKALEY